MSETNPQSKPGDATPLPGLDEQADHSVNEETPLGWDQAPLGEDQPKPHRHPRQAGLGGTTPQNKPSPSTQTDTANEK